MGGPWRSREFDARSWRPAPAHAGIEREAPVSRSGAECLLGVVVAYVAAVLTSTAVVLALLRAGW